MTKSMDDVIYFLSQLDLCIIDNILYRYVETGGYWKPFEDIMAYKEIVAKISGGKEMVKITKPTLKAAFEAVKCQSGTLVPNIELENIKGREYVVVLENASLKLENNSLWKRIPERESKNFYITHKLKGTCFLQKEERNRDVEKAGKIFEQFMKTSFPNDTQNSRQALLEIMGYIFSNFLRVKKAFFLIGQPSSGKSVILQFIESILGDSFVSHIDLDKLGMRFNVAELAGKKANLSGEVSSGKIKDIAAFKKIVGRDTTIAEFKGRDPFSFRFSVKLLTAGNQLPDFSVSDGSTSTVERIHVLYFPKKIPKEEQDPELLEKLLLERNYIVSEALDAMAKVRSNGYRFLLTKDSEKLLQEYCQDAQIFDRFIESCCELGNEEFKVYKSDLWDRFYNFCQENGTDVLLSKKVFYCKVSSISEVQGGKGRIEGGKPLALFIGIRLQKEENKSSGTTEH